MLPLLSFKVIQIYFLVDIILPPVLFTVADVVTQTNVIWGVLKNNLVSSVQEDFIILLRRVFNLEKLGEEKEQRLFFIFPLHTLGIFFDLVAFKY